MVTTFNISQERNAVRVEVPASIGFIATLIHTKHTIIQIAGIALADGLNCINGFVLNEDYLEDIFFINHSSENSNQRILGPQKAWDGKYPIVLSLKIILITSIIGSDVGPRSFYTGFTIANLLGTFGSLTSTTDISSRNLFGEQNGHLKDGSGGESTQDTKVMFHTIMNLKINRSKKRKRSFLTGQLRFIVAEPDE